MNEPEEESPTDDEMPELVAIPRAPLELSHAARAGRGEAVQNWVDALALRPATCATEFMLCAHLSDRKGSYGGSGQR